MRGLYLHIPYCKALCHYCDFAKTANFGDEAAQSYLGQLAAHTAVWLDAETEALTSVFFGGGTPSLFTHEYAPLMALVRPHLAADCEISLEANPDDVTAASLAAWRSLGVNRLSLGVQTFDAAGLAFMKRMHSPAEAMRAIETARSSFASLNVDLIYGWPGQDTALFERDVRQAVACGATHLSLYTLTYETRTPIGRAASRGVIAPESDEGLATKYERACDVLGTYGFEHEEVSNWSKPGASCRHNWLYWQDHSYIGVGAGAHGYLSSDEGPGVRYAYGRNDRAFARRAPSAALALDERFGVDVEAVRARADWLLEYVGCGLRCSRGIDVALAERKSRMRFVPTPNVEEALARGLLTRAGDRLRLLPREWFRETAWSLEVISSFGPAAKELQ